jgi:hypothetical protein
MDYQQRLAMGDHVGAAEAQRRLARAEAQSTHLAAGKQALDEKYEQRQYQQQPQRQWTTQDYISLIGVRDAYKRRISSMRRF